VQEETWTKAGVPQASGECQNESVRGGQSDARMTWLAAADTNWRTLRPEGRMPAPGTLFANKDTLLSQILQYSSTYSRQPILYNLFFLQSIIGTCSSPIGHSLVAWPTF
jgi:hypothetical protein